mmetsp:Transcript_45717/g.141310  ORF Transcript_45717/g.141310 Transcript_45717/m.141310 type:complete len:250 (-) Transcript_45717:187-936(-)
METDVLFLRGQFQALANKYASLVLAPNHLPEAALQCAGPGIRRLSLLRRPLLLSPQCLRLSDCLCHAAPALLHLLLLLCMCRDKAGRFCLWLCTQLCGLTPLLMHWRRVAPGLLSLLLLRLVEAPGLFCQLLLRCLHGLAPNLHCLFFIVYLHRFGPVLRCMRNPAASLHCLLLHRPALRLCCLSLLTRVRRTALCLHWLLLLGLFLHSCRCRLPFNHWNMLLLKCLRCLRCLAIGLSCPPCLAPFFEV